ncbi:MAG: chorismate synthase [Thermoguttaceae bacterium]|nr:chorismate synthase [Thermoguttaceae bacterium]
MLTCQTAGESHGKGLYALINGFPAGVQIDCDVINAELQRRQGGYGRGGRQSIETDTVDVQTGILHGKSTGAPISLWVKNKDYKIESMPELVEPRPGHGDLTGSIKYLSGIRPILERSSARETAARVAAGALGALLLKEFGIVSIGFVDSIGPLSLSSENRDSLTPEEIRSRRDASVVYSLVPDKDEQARELIDRCRLEGDTLGGIIEVRVFNVPFGLGSHVQWSQKLDARLAMAAMSVQAIKGVELGLGFEAARRMGSQVHDPIGYDASKADCNGFGIIRSSNNAGGTEAGISNSQPLVVRAAMKPIATLRKPLGSINLKTKEATAASYERSDVCAVSAASVVLENVIAFEVATAMIEKFGGDSLKEMLARVQLNRHLVKEHLG